MLLACKQALREPERSPVPEENKENNNVLTGPPSSKHARSSRTNFGPSPPLLLPAKQAIIVFSVSIYFREKNIKLSMDMLLPCILYCDAGPGCLMRTAFKYIIGLLIREIIFSLICPLRLFFGDAAVYPQESYTFAYRLYVSRARCIGLFKSFVCSGSILYKYSCLRPGRWSSSALEGSPSRRRETPISNQLVLQVNGWT